MQRPCRSISAYLAGCQGVLQPALDALRRVERRAVREVVPSCAPADRSCCHVNHQLYPKNCVLACGSCAIKNEFGYFRAQRYSRASCSDQASQPANEQKTMQRTDSAQMSRAAGYQPRALFALSCGLPMHLETNAKFTSFRPQALRHVYCVPPWSNNRPPCRCACQRWR